MCGALVPVIYQVFSTTSSVDGKRRQLSSGRPDLVTNVHSWANEEEEEEEEEEKQKQMPLFGF